MYLPYRTRADYIPNDKQCYFERNRHKVPRGKYSKVAVQKENILVAYQYLIPFIKVEREKKEGKSSKIVLYNDDTRRRIQGERFWSFPIFNFSN